jgi:hypothetical protein
MCVLSIQLKPTPVSPQIVMLSESETSLTMSARWESEIVRDPSPAQDDKGQGRRWGSRETMLNEIRDVYGSEK